MVKYKQIEHKGDVFVYSYWPEGKDISGIVSINAKTGETSVIAESKNDIGNRYAFKLINWLSRLSPKDKYPSDGLIAWY